MTWQIVTAFCGGIWLGIIATMLLLSKAVASGEVELHDLKK